MRKSNIELLRILAMLMIIGLHYWGIGTSTIAENHSNALVYRICESFCICGVDLFVIITSWFSTEQNKINFLKIFRLLIEVSFWGIVSLFLAYCVREGPFDLVSIIKVSVPYLWKGRWFVEAYVIFIILIPFVNVCLRNIGQKQHLWLLIISFVLFILWPSFLPNPPIDDYGYGFVHFLSLYILVSYIKRSYNIIGCKLMCIAAFIISFFLVLWQSLRDVSTCWMYNNIFVIFEALFLFLLFIQFDFKSHVINLLASVSFGVFLIHSDSLFFGPLVYFDIFHADVYAKGSATYLIVNFIICLPLFYLGCFVLEMFRSMLFKYSIDKVLNRFVSLKTLSVYKNS